MCASLSPVLSSTKILARQACYRPITADGLPLIGRVPGVAGAYVATGHSVWGILNAPATGEAMAELILDGVVHKVDLRPFDPSRLPPVEPETMCDCGEFSFVTDKSVASCASPKFRCSSAVRPFISPVRPKKFRCLKA